MRTKQIRTTVAALIVATVPFCAKAEVAGCNADAGKMILSDGTFGKFREISSQQLHEAQALKPDRRADYICPPFTAPYTGPRPPSGYVPGQGYRPSFNAQRNPQTGKPLTEEDYRQGHVRACAVRQQEIDEYNKREENLHRLQQERIVMQLAVLEKMDVAFINIHQQAYDSNSDVRYCSSDVQYVNWDQSFIKVFSPACSKTVSYKIEKLLDKPGQIYVSWLCDRSLSIDFVSGEHETPKLKVSATARGLEIVNMGSTLVRILDIDVNGRDDCSTISVSSANFSKDYLHKIWVADGTFMYIGIKDGKLYEIGSDRILSTEPKTLRTGDAGYWVPRCSTNYVSVTVTTDGGKVTYSFR